MRATLTCLRCATKRRLHSFALASPHLTSLPYTCFSVLSLLLFSLQVVHLSLLFGATGPCNRPGVTSASRSYPADSHHAALRPLYFVPAFYKHCTCCQVQYVLHDNAMARCSRALFGSARFSTPPTLVVATLPCCVALSVKEAMKNTRNCHYMSLTT